MMQSIYPSSSAAHRLLQVLVPLVDDLSRDMPDAERYRKLLAAVRALIPGDAVALLQLEGSQLRPVAVDGLTADTLGRRFRLDEHPRLAMLVAATGPMRFPADSPLPDPYDGLIEGLHRELEVHDCMGCAIRMDGIAWGLITVDALDVGKFSDVELGDLQALASLAAATAGVAGRISQLASNVEIERQRADSWKALASRHSPPALLGQSPAFRILKEEIDTVGASDLTVLLAGETGVGKELVARALHAASPRATKPLVVINCAALPETLVESELFGHVRGAFSGAVSDRRGKFELASGGTLFMDEVGELSLAIQAKLLRVLQNGQLQRLGSDREHNVDVRVIAATNRDLAAEVRSGRYRADFYHRLSVYPLMVPALRDRRQDVLLLAGNFLEQNRSRLGLVSLRLSDDARTALLAYAWPGNVRELEHSIGRSALKALAETRNAAGAIAAVRPTIVSIAAKHLNLPLGSKPSDLPPDQHCAHTGEQLLSVDLRTSLDSYQRQRIEICLLRHAGNWASAARELDLYRPNLVRLARRLGIATGPIKTLPAIKAMRN